MNQFWSNGIQMLKKKQLFSYKKININEYSDEPILFGYIKKSLI